MAEPCDLALILLGPKDVCGRCGRPAHEHPEWHREKARTASKKTLPPRLQQRHRQPRPRHLGAETIREAAAAHAPPGGWRDTDQIPVEVLSMGDLAWILSELEGTEKEPPDGTWPAGDNPTHDDLDFGRKKF